MIWLRSFFGVLKKEITLAIRYPLNFISVIVSVYLIFLFIFFGVKIMKGPNIGESIEAIIVGFFLWLFAIMGYSTVAWGIADEAKRGTLEQLYMSPCGFLWTISASMAASFIINIIISGVLLFFMMLTTGKWLHITYCALGILIFPALFSYGVGLIAGGLVLIFKQIQAFLQIVQFLFVFLVSAPLSAFPFLRYCPLTLSTKLLNLVVIKDASVTVDDWLILVITTLFWISVGVVFFRTCERIARDKALLAHY